MSDQQDLATLKDELVSGELAEVILLLDHLSGRSDRNISGLHLDEDHPDLVRAVFEAHWPPEKGRSDEDVAEAATVLFKARDQLNELATPANGASIAFTILVTGEDDGTTPEALGPRIRTTRNGLAYRAYPRYVQAAKRFRRFRHGLFILLGATLFVTSVVSWHVAAGQFFLQAIADNDTRRVALLPDAYMAEAATGEPAVSGNVASGTSGEAAPKDTGTTCGKDGKDGVGCTGGRAEYCGIDRAGDAPSARDPALQQKTCRDLRSLRDARCKAAYALELWHQNWTWLTFPIASMPDPDGKGAKSVWECMRGNPLEVESLAVEPVSADIVQVFGSAVLPTLYGLLGALAAIGLSIHRKTKESSLMPRDHAQLRLMTLLGVVVGGCIGLFLSPVAATTTIGNAGSNVTMSASGLSFLAGLGVERVFNWLDGLIRSLFGTTSATAVQVPSGRSSTQTNRNVPPPPPAPDGRPVGPGGGAGQGTDGRMTGAGPAAVDDGQVAPPESP